MSWRTEYSPDKIVVYFNEIEIGEYKLLPEPYCRKCASPIRPWSTRTPGAVLSCNKCSSLEGFSRVYAVGCYYVGPPYPQLTRHILDLKEDREIAKPLCMALVTVIEKRYPELTMIDALVPVPAHDRKLDERGFNQADLLANGLGYLINKPVLDCLRQTKLYEQREATRDERFENVRGAFIPEDDLEVKIRGKHLLLIDDVFTSGATISECSKVLLSCGARQVDVLVLGRTCQR